MFATKCCSFLCFKDAMVLTKWGFFFLGGAPCLQQSVPDFFVSKTPWC